MPDPTSFSRKAKLEDFLDDDDKPNQTTQNKYKNYSNNDTITIEKNQQEFGNRKRIKP
jgi:hypothetical protein